jgi:hypothetical protein
MNATMSDSININTVIMQQVLKIPRRTWSLEFVLCADVTDMLLCWRMNVERLDRAPPATNPTAAYPPPPAAPTAPPAGDKTAPTADLTDPEHERVGPDTEYSVRPISPYRTQAVISGTM